MGKTGIDWDLQKALAVPEIFWAEGVVSPDSRIKPLFFQNVDYKGHPTRVFAWLGIPESTSGSVPGMVLVHGGGGTAFFDWVRLWCDRGYAAIAIDTCGVLGVIKNSKKRIRHEYAGPNGNGDFDSQNKPVTEQWPYQAVQAITRAHSLLRSEDCVDVTRVGITGISWGAVLTCIAASLDKRFCFAIPVYGSGYLDDDSVWKYGEAPPEKYSRWYSLWDPRHYLDKAIIPMCWINGTNDFAFFLPSHQKSYHTAKGKRTVVIHHEMIHGQEAGGGCKNSPLEIPIYANSLVMGGAPLPRITGKRSNVEAKEVQVLYESETEIISAEFLFTRATGYWPDRRWNRLPAGINRTAHTASAPIQAGTTAFFINIKDQRGAVVSSEIEILAEKS